MKIIKYFSLLTLAMLILLLAYSFANHKNARNDLSQKNDTNQPQENGVSQPIEKTAFEKTRGYGKLDCQNFQTNPLAGQIFKLINADRKKNGKSELAWNTKLCQSATLKAADMVRYSYFEHVSPNLVTPWHWMDMAGYKYIFSGENLALNYYTADSAHTALMNSPGHRANILSDNFTEVGISYDWGKVDSQDAFFIVEHFGQPALANPPTKIVCTDIEKAQKNIKELNNQLDEINNYLDKAQDILKQYQAAGQNTKPVTDYIDDLNNKKKQVKKYIQENQSYLDGCKKL